MEFLIIILGNTTPVFECTNSYDRQDLIKYKDKDTEKTKILFTINI